MAESNLDLSTDDKLLSFRIRWVEFFLATVSFYIVIWIIYQYLGLLGQNPPNDSIFYYRSNGGILVIRFLEVLAHGFFVQLIIRRAFFPQMVNPKPGWVLIALLSIVALPWVEQFYATSQIPNLVVIDQYSRRLIVIFISFGYLMLPFWKHNWARFYEYQTGIKIALTLSYLVVLSLLMKFIP